jgi:hypothetical protein
MVLMAKMAKTVLPALMAMTDKMAQTDSQESQAHKAQLVRKVPPVQLAHQLLTASLSLLTHAEMELDLTKFCCNWQTAR